MATDKRTEPSQTVEKLIAAFVLLVAAALGVLAYTVAELRADVVALRHAAERAAAPETATEPAPEQELRDEIARLAAELQASNRQLAEMLGAIAGFDDGLKRLDAGLAASASRQEGFERWAITRLGPSPQPTALPPGWYSPQVEIINRIKAGDEPLGGWERSAAGAQ